MKILKTDEKLNAEVLDIIFYGKCKTFVESGEENVESIKDVTLDNILNFAKDFGFSIGEITVIAENITKGKIYRYTKGYWYQVGETIGRNYCREEE